MILESQEGHIVQDECFVVRYYDRRFSIRGIKNTKVSDYFLKDNYSWKLRMIMNERGDLFFYREDWMGFLNEVFTRQDIDDEILMSWIRYELRLGTPTVPFEKIP